MFNVLKTLIQLKRDEKGVTALEYGLIAALVAVVIMGAVGSLGASLADTFNGVASHFAVAGAAPHGHGPHHHAAATELS